MWPNLSLPVDFVTSTEKILNGKRRFLSSGANELALILKSVVKWKKWFNTDRTRNKKKGESVSFKYVFSMGFKSKELNTKKIFQYILMV